jgi:hypothetical protein
MSWARRDSTTRIIPIICMMLGVVAEFQNAKVLVLLREIVRNVAPN